MKSYALQALSKMPVEIRNPATIAGRREVFATPARLSITWLMAVLGFACGSHSGGGVDGAGMGGGYNAPGSSLGGAGDTSTNGTGSTGNGTGSTGSGTNTNTNTSNHPYGCVIGSQGCTCDSLGACSSGMNCNAGTCCDAASGDCAPSTGTGTGTSTGTYTGGSTGTSTDTNTGTGSSCTPGVVGPVITDCGYPYTSSNPLTGVVFNESEVLRSILPTGGSLATVRVFYGDEHALTLGVRSVVVKSASGSTSTDYAISPLSSDPSSVMFPQTGSNVLYGNQAGLDPSLRPMWPSLFITDITNDPNNRAGDWQQGGRPFNPNAVYGTWKSAVRTVDTTVTPNIATITPDADPAKNNWNLGSGADPVPSDVMAGKNEGYSAEIVWQLALIPGHSYRVQAIVHDGDQNKVGGDSGEACVDFCAGYDVPDGGTVPPPDGGGTPPPPQCQEGSAICGPGGIDPSECPIGYICANGCCTYNIG